MDQSYCGAAPAPQDLLLAWNFDPVAIALCMGLIAFHLAGYGRGNRLALAGGIGVLLVLFVSPLCALTVALFSARATHHILLVAVAAPLLALAFPLREGARERVSVSALSALHAAILWFWHVPQVYAAAISEAVPYWTMQLTLLASAFFLWRSVLVSRRTGEALVGLLATVIQMGMLGALLTLAPTPLYPPHFSTTQAFGLSPLADQQLAGLIMWVPAALPYLAAALLILSERLGRAARAAG
jgi:Predicted membrane protein